MGAQYKKLNIENFKSGLITRVPDTNIPEDAFSDCQNIELNNKYLPTKMKGHTKYNSVTLGAYPVRGAYVYTKTDGTKYYVVACAGKLFYSIAGSGTFTAYQIGGSDLTIDNDVDVEFVQYNDYLYIVNGQYPIITNGGYTTSRMIKIDGTTPSELTGADIPQGLKYIIIHQERMFGANSIDQSNGLYWTEPYDMEDWTPSYGLNYDYVGKDDGENISGIYTYQNYVFVFKPRNIYRYSTVGDITQWGSIRVDARLGSLYHRCIKEMEGYLYYLSPEGVVKFDGNNAVLISEQIRDKMLELPQLTTQADLTWLQTTTSDFDTGDFDTKNIDTSGNELKQNSINNTTSWDTNRGLMIDVDEKVKAPVKIPQQISDYNSFSHKFGDNIYFIIGGSSYYFYKFDLTNYTWTRLSDTPISQTYAMGIYDNGTDIHLAQNSGYGYNYNISSNNWTISSIYYDNPRSFNFVYYNTKYYWIIDRGTSAVLKNQSGDVYTLPLYTGDNYSLHLLGDNIYISYGYNQTRFDKYSISGASLTNLTALPVTPPSISGGVSITNNGTDLYFVFGNSGTSFYRYNVSANTWTSLAASPTQYGGCRISYDGDESILFAPGDDPSPSTYPFADGYYSYNITKDTWDPYVISETIDFKETPASFGNISTNITGDIVFQSKSSATDLSDANWELASGWSSNIANNGAIPSTVQRYLRIKVIPQKTTQDNLLEETFIGSVWKSVKKDLGQAPTSWGKFESSYILNSQTVTFWMRAATTEVGLDSATWYQQTPGTNIVSVPLNQWIQVEIRVNTTLYSQLPTVESFKIYYSFGNGELISPCAIVWKNNYWLTVADDNSTYNNIAYIYNKDGYWLFRTNKKNNVYFIDDIYLLSGTSESDGFLRYNDINFLDDDTNIDSWFETRNFELSLMVNLFRRIFATSKSSVNWTLSYSIDNGSYTDFTINSSTYQETILKTFSGIARGQFIKFKIRQNSEDANFEFNKLLLLWKPLREINSE